MKKIILILPFLLISCSFFQNSAEIKANTVKSNLVLNKKTVISATLLPIQLPSNFSASPTVNSTINNSGTPLAVSSASIQVTTSASAGTVSGGGGGGASGSVVIQPKGYLTGKVSTEVSASPEAYISSGNFISGKIAN